MPDGCQGVGQSALGASALDRPSTRASAVVEFARESDVDLSAAGVDVVMSTGRTTLNLALSVDGFIATADGGVSWLEAIDDASDDPDVLDSFRAFFDGVDCLVMGSRTYEKILDHAE